MGLYGMSSMSEIFRGKVPGLPKLEEGHEQSERVTENIMGKRLNLKEKGEAMKLKLNSRNTDNLFKSLQPAKTNMNFDRYLKFGNKQSQENKVWNMLRPRQLGRDMFSRNEVIAQGAEDIVPDTQDVISQAQDLGLDRTVDVSPTRKVDWNDRSATEQQSDPNIYQQLSPKLQKGAKAVAGFVLPTVFTSDNVEPPQKGFLSQAAGRLRDRAGKAVYNKTVGLVREKWAQEDAKNAAKEGKNAVDYIAYRRAVESGEVPSTNKYEDLRKQYNLEIARDLKRQQLGLLPTTSRGKGKTGRIVTSFPGFSGGMMQQGGMMSNVLPRTYQDNWRTYVGSNVPGSERSISSAISGGALSNREESILRMARTGGNLQAGLNSGGSTQQLLNTIRSYDNPSTPVGLTGSDKIRWILASPSQKEEMLKLLQQMPAQQPVMQQQVDYQQEQPTQRQPSQGREYSPYSKKPVTYVRGPYNKNRQ